MRMQVTAANVIDGWAGVLIAWDGEKVTPGARCIHQNNLDGVPALRQVVPQMLQYLAMPAWQAYLDSDP